MSPKTANRPLPKLIWHLGWISFFADISSEMIYPIIPLFVTASLGAPVAALGLIEGAAAAIVSLMKGLSGIHQDQTGKKVPYIRWGYGLSAVAKPILAIATLWPMVLGARLLDRTGKGVRTTARDALIAEGVEPSLYGRAYGLHGSLDTAGAFVGVSIALALLFLFPGQYRAMFVAAALPGLVSWLLTLKVRDLPAQTTVESPKWTWASLRDLPRSYWQALVILIVFGLANSSDTLILLRAKDLGLTELQTVGAYALYNLVFTLVSYPAGQLSDRFGRWQLLGMGWLLYAFVYWGFASLTSAWLPGLFLLYGIFVGLTRGVTKALVAEIAPGSQKGAAIGIFNMATGFAALAASAAAGLLWDRAGAAMPFYAGSALAFVAALLALLNSRRSDRSHKVS
ncbi:MAG: MFS transporter [Fimbriimonas sp.]